MEKAATGNEENVVLFMSKVPKRPKCWACGGEFGNIEPFYKGTLDGKKVRVHMNQVCQEKLFQAMKEDQSRQNSIQEASA